MFDAISLKFPGDQSLSYPDLQCSGIHDHLCILVLQEVVKLWTFICSKHVFLQLHLLISFGKTSLLFLEVGLSNDDFMIQGTDVCYNHLEPMYVCPNCIPCQLQPFCFFNRNLAFIFWLIIWYFHINHFLLSKGFVWASTWRAHCCQRSFKSLLQASKVLFASTLHAQHCWVLQNNHFPACSRFSSIKWWITIQGPSM